MLLSNSTPADGQLGPGSPHEGDSGPVWYNHPAESVPGMSALFSANRKWWLGDSVELGVDASRHCAGWATPACVP